MTTRPVGGVLWFFDLAHGLIFCEGRLACLLDGHEEAVGLRSPVDLRRAVRCAASAIAELRIALDPTAARIRRLDLAGDVRFVDARLGRSLLRALLEQAAGDKQPYYNGSVLGSVEWIGGSTFAFRCYDRGAKTGELPAGELIRVEREWRPEWHARRPDGQPLVDGLLDAHDLTARWLGDFEASVAPITAPLLSPDDAELVIRTHKLEGRLSRETAVRLRGTIRALEDEGYAGWGAGASDRRVRNQAVATLRRLGVEVISPTHRRGTPWPDSAHCRPAGLVLWITEVIAMLRTAMETLLVSSPENPMHDGREPDIASLLASLGCEEEPPQPMSACRG